VSPDRSHSCWIDASRLFLLAVVLVVAATQPVAAQFAIDELEMHFVPNGSGAMTKVIPIRSSSDTAQQVRITVRDWERDSIGGNAFLDFGSHRATCQGRLEVFPLTLQLGPQATEFVRVTYTGTAAPDPGCWAVVFTETVRPPSAREQGAAVSISTVMGVKIYVHAPGATADGSVISADVEEYWEPRPTTSDSTLVRDVAVRFANTGTAHLRVRSSLEVRNEATQIVARVDGPEAYITPEAFRDILIRLPNLPRGRFVAVVLLDYGADEITAAQVEFEVP
jgi:hypothetical protein